MTQCEHNSPSAFSQGSGEVRSPSEPVFLAVGRVLRPHGLRGELRVEIHTDYPERFALHKRLYLGPVDAPSSSYACYSLTGHRFHQGTVLLKLAGVDDREQAGTFRDQWVWIPLEEAVPLAEGECYLYQMLGLRVRTLEGEDLGQIAEILETGTRPVYIVQGIQGELLIPDTEEVIVQVDLPAGQVTVRLIEGLR